jgi:hypothetical protein
MEFDPRNNVVALCVQGMGMEDKGKPEEASRLFLQAWNAATNDFEKFTAAYYVARHRETVRDKLQWLETSLRFALRINDVTVRAAFPFFIRASPNAMKNQTTLTTLKRIMNWQIRSRAIRGTTAPFITERKQICRPATY